MTTQKTPDLKALYDHVAAYSPAPTPSAKPSGKLKRATKTSKAKKPKTNPLPSLSEGIGKKKPTSPIAGLPANPPTLYPTPKKKPSAPIGGLPANPPTLYTPGKSTSSLPNTVSANVPLNGSKVSTTPTSVSKKGSTSTGTKTPITTTPEITQEDFLARYGTTLDFINSDDSLKKLFLEASKAKWDGPRFEAELLQTAWAKKYTAGAQASEKSRTTNPSTWADSFNRMRETVAQLATVMGESVRPEDVGVTSDIKNPTRQDGTITQWALEHASDTDFEASLRRYIASRGQVNLSLPGGNASSIMTQLKAYAGQMGLGSMALAGGADYFSNAAQSILLGKSTAETWQTQLLQQAKNKYKSFAPSLDAGQTV